MKKLNKSQMITIILILSFAIAISVILNIYFGLQVSTVLGKPGG